MTREETLDPSNPLEGPIPDSPASEQPAVEQPASESGPEGQAPEGAVDGVEEAPRSWINMSPVEVLEHEAIRPLVEEATTAASKTSYDKAYADVQARLQPIYSKNREILDGISASADDILAQLRRGVEDNLLEGRTVEDLLRRHRPVIDVLRNVQVTETVGNVLGDLAQRIGFTPSPDVVMGYEDWKGGKSQDEAFLDGFVEDVRRNLGNDMLTKADAEEMAVKRSKKDLAEYKAALAAEQQAKGGAPVGAFAPGSPAGGRSEKELLADPATPIETLMQIRSRQRAAQ